MQELKNFERERNTFSILENPITLCSYWLRKEIINIGYIDGHTRGGHCRRTASTDT
jgi:hypothetical protein